MTLSGNADGVISVIRYIGIGLTATAYAMGFIAAGIHTFAFHRMLKRLGEKALMDKGIDPNLSWHYGKARRVYLERHGQDRDYRMTAILDRAVLWIAILAGVGFMLMNCG